MWIALLGRTGIFVILANCVLVFTRAKRRRTGVRFSPPLAAGSTKSRLASHQVLLWFWARACFLLQPG